MENLLYAPAIGAFFNVAFDRMVNKGFLNFLTRRGSTEELVEELRRKRMEIEERISTVEGMHMADEAVKSLVVKAKDIVYDAQDLVDWIDTEASHPKTRAETLGAALGSLFIKDADSEIRDTYQKLVTLEVKINSLILKEGRSRELSTSFVDESVIFGRDDQKNQIIGFLGASNPKNVI